MISGTQIIILSWYLRSPIRPSEMLRKPAGPTVVPATNETPWWSAMERTVGFLEVAKDNPNRWKLGRVQVNCWGKKSHRFLKGLTWGFVYFLATRFKGETPKTKTAKQKLITLTPKLFTENKKHHYKETRKFLWSSLHNWFTISSSSKHCTQVGHGRAKNRDLLDPPLLWRRGSHLFRQQASEPRQQPCGNRWVDSIWYENSWNCCHFGRFFPSSTFVPIILTMFCTCVLGDGWIVWKNMYAATNWEEKSIGNEVRISCLSCVCFFYCLFFSGDFVIIVSYDFQGWWYTGLRSVRRNCLNVL